MRFGDLCSWVAPAVVCCARGHLRYLAPVSQRIQLAHNDGIAAIAVVHAAIAAHSMARAHPLLSVPGTGSTVVGFNCGDGTLAQAEDMQSWQARGCRIQPKKVQHQAQAAH
jgi:hypothetical protein